MRNVLIAVFAVAIIGALSIWLFLLREVPAPSTAAPLPPARQASPAPAAPAETTTSAVLPTGADVPAVTQDAVLEGEGTDTGTISISFYGVAQAGSSGAPVAGATVRLVSMFTDDFENIPNLPDHLKAELDSNFSTTTDADGAYRLELKDVIAGMLAMASLTCESPGYARSHVSFDYTDALEDGMERRQDFFLKVGSKVSGRVTRADTGATVEGAKIIAAKVNAEPFGDFDAHMEPELATTSGADGQYTLGGLEEATYTLIAATPDSGLIIPTKARPRIKVLPGTDLEKDLVLSPAAAVRGTVTFPPGATRPEYASVFVSRTANVTDIMSGGLQEMMHDSFSSSSGKLEDDGSYQIGGLEFGVEYTVSLDADAFAKTKSAPFTIAEGQSPVTVDLVVLRGSTLRGKAVHEDGKPAVGVDLQLTRGMAAMMSGDFESFLMECKTKDDGTFEIANVSAGEYRVVARKDLFKSFNPFAADAGEDEDAPVAVDGVHDVNDLVVLVSGNARGPGTGVITGTLLDQEGKPVVGSMVHAYAYTEGDTDSVDTTTAADGTFRLEKLSGDEYTVSAFGNGEQAKVSDVAPGSDIVLQFAPEAKITGTVVDSAGNPVDGCTVQLQPRAEAADGLNGMFEPKQMMAMMGMRGETARTDTFGLFEIKDFEPGRYVVRVLASSAGYGESEAFSVSDGESKDNLNIKLAKGVVFSGTVLDSGGAPVAGARVSLTEAAAANPMFDQVLDMMPEMLQQGGDGAETDDAGNFAFHNFAPGDYKVSAKAEGLANATDSVTLVAGRDVTGYRIVLARGGCIAGTAISKGDAKAGLMVQAMGNGGMKQAMSGEGGRFELCGLNAGSYMVTVVDMSGMMSGDISGFLPVVRKAEVVDGETTEVDFGPKEGTVTVRGTVHGKLGKITTVSLKKIGAPEPSLADAFNMDAAMEALEFMGGNAMADANGAFSIDEVMPGDYVLEVHSVTIDPTNLDVDSMMEVNMKPAIRQNVTVPAGTGLTLDLELPEAE